MAQKLDASTEIASRARLLAKVLSAQGPGWVLQRAGIRLRKRLRVAELTSPVAEWEAYPFQRLLRPGIPSDSREYFNWRTANAARFFFTGSILSSPMVHFPQGRVIQDADRILDGVFPFFGHHRQFGFPPKWQHHPDSNRELPRGHWSRIDEFGHGDIKVCWEPSRFGWVFTLARAYARTLDNRYAEAFWTLLEDWMRSNPPNFGVNWVCGQEAGLRTLALCFGWHAFAEADASTQDRKLKLLRAIWFHARRVNAFIGYAISQKNNHAISEASCLWWVGLLFSEFREALAWRERGRKILEKAAAEQIFGDGGYIQQSANYHRVMLQEMAWDLRLGEVCGQRLSSDVYRKVNAATKFLQSITDASTGWAPNYGPNDGALVFPLTDCAYPDMRPVLQVCTWVTQSTRLYSAGPWDEELAWVCGEAATKSNTTTTLKNQSELDAPDGGCYTLHNGESWAMMRASRYRTRPAQADQLHFDLWWRGRNVLCDAGTYSYNAQAPFDDGLASTRRHNTAVIDGRDQMTRISRFFWADWAPAKVRRLIAPLSQVSVLQAEHTGYAKYGVLHKRSVACVEGSIWIIVDDFIGKGDHSIMLHWLVDDAKVRTFADSAMSVELPYGLVHLGFFSGLRHNIDVVRAGRRIASTNTTPVSDVSRGWIARYYAHKEPALSAQLQCRSRLPLRIITAVSLGQEPAIVTSCDIIETQRRSIKLVPIGDSSVFS